MHFDLLECRRLMSVTTNHGTITVTGTTSADHLSVRNNHGDPTKFDVTLNGVTTSYSKLDYYALVLDGSDGNDHINVNDNNGIVDFPVTLIGDRGHDIMHGGAGNQNFDGGAGPDIIYGGAGNDTIYGSTGGDALFGEDGNDYLRGGRGHDKLNGGKGDDDCDGGKEIDTIVGGKGNDDFTVDDYPREIHDFTIYDNGDNSNALIADVHADV